MVHTAQEMIENCQERERAQDRGRLKLEKTGIQCWTSISTMDQLEDNMDIRNEITGCDSKFGS